MLPIRLKSWLRILQIHSGQPQHTGAVSLDL